MSEEQVRHLLLFFCSGNISLVERKDGKCEAVEFSGEKKIPYNADFWGMMERHISLKDIERIDLCVIGDKDCGGMEGIGIPRKIIADFRRGKNIWGVRTVRDAFEELSPGTAAEVLSPEGEPLFTLNGSSRDKETSELIWYNFPEGIEDDLKKEQEIESAKKTNALTAFMQQMNRDAESRKIK